MPEQYRPNLGEVPDDTARRDAVHIAVIPLIAAVNLKAGERFALNANGKAIKPLDHWCGTCAIPPVGIVDPFRRGIIPKGSRFWGFLFPNTITDLRHVWSHPAFKAKPPGQETATHE